MASSLHQLAGSIKERSKGLLNQDLKKICKEEGQPQSGNKVLLQQRVATVIDNAVSKGDAEALRRIQYRVANRGEAPPDGNLNGSLTTPAAPHQPSHGASSYSMGNASAYMSYAHQAAPPRPTNFFKDSPFFQIRELIVNNVVLDASPSHRQVREKSIIVNETICSRLKSDKSLRLMLYGAQEQPLTPFTRLDVSFPSQIEVKINDEEVKANYKGLKNKPGSTRPVDITDFVRISPANYRNILMITYALTPKESPQRYNLYVYMVRRSTVDELAAQIKERRVITKQHVLNEMMKKANDPDIEVGSSVMSLKDPISTLRISTPCRSTVCSHNQCFDALSFLQLQEQAPTWQCPICNKVVTFEGLAVDEYVEEILSKVRDTEVTIQPNGQWSTQLEPESSRKNGYQTRNDSDDDLIEITDFRVSNIKNEVPTPVSISTPPLASRETSTAPRSSTKRPAAAVIDLTLSDDDEPPRPAKKVAYRPPNNNSTPSHRYLPPIATSAARPSLPPAYQGISLSPQTYPNRPTSPSQPSGYGYRPPPPSRPSYSGQGTAQYPAYLGSSP